jgi:succinate-acetate transporter protein
MSTGAHHAPAPGATATTNGLAAALDEWRGHTRIFLQPIAAPSILGLFGFSAATFITTAYLVGWYGNMTSPLLIFPFAMAAGGFAQGGAALWAYKARDGLATAVHGIWAAFWIAYGILNILAATHAITIPANGPFKELGFWFFMLAAITVSGAFASLAESMGLFAVLSTLAVGAALLGVGYYAGGSGWLDAGAWVLIASAICAFYTASAMMFESAYGRVMLPLGQPRKAANVPGRTPTRLIEFHSGEPGIRHGQ